MTFSLGPRAASAGYRLAAFDHIGSTNAEAMSCARDGECGPMWFVTSEQTAGRGRRHRPLIAPRGNLARSILEVIGGSLTALGVHVGAEELFTVLSDCWAEFRGLWDNGRGFGEVRRLWLARAAGLGQPVAIQSGGSTVEGTFDTIDESGCMIIRTLEGKLVPISAVEVRF